MVQGRSRGRSRGKDVASALWLQQLQLQCLTNTNTIITMLLAAVHGPCSGQVRGAVNVQLGGLNGVACTHSQTDRYRQTDGQIHTHTHTLSLSLIHAPCLRRLLPLLTSAPPLPPPLNVCRVNPCPRHCHRHPVTVAAVAVEVVCVTEHRRAMGRSGCCCTRAGARLGLASGVAATLTSPSSSQVRLLRLFCSPLQFALCACGCGCSRL